MFALCALLLTLNPSLAQDDAEPEPADDTDQDADDEPSKPAPAARPRRVIQLAPTSDVPSALDELETLANEAPDKASREFWKAALEVQKERGGTPIRGAWFARPRLALGFSVPTGSGFKPGFAAGAVVGHRWWPVRSPKRVEWGGETTLWAEGYVGGLKGAGLGLSTTAGPWIGPVGISLGISTDLTRFVAAESVVPTGLMIGPEAVVAVDTGAAMVWLGAAPKWSATKGRDKGVGPLPTLGTETTWTAGVAVNLGLFQPRLHAAMRSTAAGPVGTVGIGLQLTPNFGREPSEEEQP